MQKSKKRRKLLSKKGLLDWWSASAMVSNTDSIVKSYFVFICSQMKNRTENIRRYPRGLFTVAAIGALSGGVLFVVIWYSSISTYGKRAWDSINKYLPYIPFNGCCRKSFGLYNPRPHGRKVGMQKKDSKVINLTGKGAMKIKPRC